MRALILTLGTRGDLELFLYLARALVVRGHEVTVAGSAFNAKAVERAGMPFVPVGGAAHGELIAALREAGGSTDLVERTRRFYETWLRPQLAPALRAIAPLAPRHDVFVNNLKVVLRRGERVLPGVSVTYDPPLSLEDLPRYGPPRREVLDLVAMPRELIDPERRWEERYQFTGFWTPPTPADTKLSPHVEDFLNNGPPPVVITLGSMAFADPAELSAMVTQALQSTRQRAVIVRGWMAWEIDERSLPQVLVVDEAPYEPLFVRAAAVAHHGGVGTLAAVLRAGRPSIILPQVACQRVLGDLLVRERLAAGVLEPGSLTAERLAACLAGASTDTELARRCATWREQLRQEDGAAAAAQSIEAHVEGLRSD